jgi:hypothetical protein
MHIGWHGRGRCEPASAILLHSGRDFHVNLNGPMRIALLLGLCITVHAAVIRGVVVEDAGGQPLARSLVVVQPIAGTGAPAQSARSNNDGQFEFAALPAGAYLVLAQRRGFAPVQYGQKQWKGSGVPLVLDDSGAASLEIRLQRFGSIAGTVLDENDVGLPDHEVVAYKNERPPELIARTQTDDRGVYRFLGLEPGSYLVRTVGKEYHADQRSLYGGRATGSRDRSRGHPAVSRKAVRGRRAGRGVAAGTGDGDAGFRRWDPERERRRAG